jgi:hypothetical protein
MAQNPNQFVQTPEIGSTDLTLASANVISATVSSSQVTTLVPGQAVKLEDSAGGLPKVLSLAADSDNTFGFVCRNVKDVERAAGENLEIALVDTVMWMQAGAAIARGASVEVVQASGKVITGAGANPVVGWAYDKAAADGDLIRVYITAMPQATGNIRTATVTATLAEINAGKVLIPGTLGKKILVTNFVERVTGAFITGTSVDLVSDATTVNVESSAQAQLTNGAVLVPASSGVTLGAGFGVALPVAEGLKVQKTGSAFAGGTSIAFTISYALVN